MQVWMSLFIGLLFFLLTPGVLVSLPPNGSTVIQAMFHAVIFAIVYHYTHRLGWLYLYGQKDGFNVMIYV
jgi:hypothetical protein